MVVGTAVGAMVAVGVKLMVGVRASVGMRVMVGIMVAAGVRVVVGIRVGLGVTEAVGVGVGFRNGQVGGFDGNGLKIQEKKFMRKESDKKAGKKAKVFFFIIGQK